MCDKLRAHFLGQPHRFGSSLARFPFRSVWPGAWLVFLTKLGWCTSKGSGFIKCLVSYFLNCEMLNKWKFYFFPLKKCCVVQLFLRYLPVDCEHIAGYSLPKSSIRTRSARAHIRTHGVRQMPRCETSICWPKLMQDLSIWLLDLVHQSFRCPSAASSHYWSRQARCPPKLLWACRKGWLQLLLYVWVHPWWWGSDVCPPCWVWFWEWHLVTMWFS